MILADTHIHTLHSFDSEMTHEELCNEYIKRGFKRIALTDHYDVDGIEDGLYPPYCVEDARRDFDRVREKFADKIELIWGMELGQPTLRPDSARKFIRDNGFEFVIGSVHNLEMTPDFIFMNFSKIPEELLNSLYARYVDLLCDTASFKQIDTLAHITYPLRYIHRDGRMLEIERFYDQYRKLFKIMIDNGIALELNTSGIRKGYVTSPDTDLLMLYRDCGGERVTCGSDSHRPPDCGADVITGIEILRKCGFKSLLIPSHDRTEEMLL